jgi:hypothetical protein
MSTVGQQPPPGLIIEAASAAALVLVALYLLLWLVFKTWCVLKLLAWRTDHSGKYDELSRTPAHLGCNYNPEHQAEGREYFKQCKVVVVGLLRDKADRLKDGRVERLVQRITDQFADYRVMVVENDSSDDTRPLLLDWSKRDPKVKVLGCGVNAPTCTMKLAKTLAHSTYAPRIQKMVDLRNIYMDALHDDPDVQDADFVVVVDLDLHAALFEEGLWDTGYQFKTHPDWSAICANGLELKETLLDNRLRYLDTYALRTEEVWNYRKRSLDDLSVMHWPLRCDVSPRKLVSGFSGLTFYRYKQMRGLRYHMIVDGYKEVACEHLSMSLQLDEVHINPALQFIVLNNDL